MVRRLSANVNLRISVRWVDRIDLPEARTKQLSNSTACQIGTAVSLFPGALRFVSLFLNQRDNGDVPPFSCLSYHLCEPVCNIQVS